MTISRYTEAHKIWKELATGNPHDSGLKLEMILAEHLIKLLRKS